MSLCWRGPPGSGKRRALQEQLQLWTRSMGQVYCVKRQSWNAPVQGGDAEEADDADASADKPLLPMEISIVHWGFDCARMSLQDKQYVKSILERWGRGSQVVASGHSQRCLVFYHAHLLSSESVLFLQAFLEENQKDTLLWLTSEYPLPQRIADWCLEIPVPSTTDRSLEKLLREAPASAKASTILTPEQEIIHIYNHWLKTPPKLSDVRQIRAIVYGLLHRNIRWTDGFHQWMFALDKLSLTTAQRKALANICIQQPFTGSGQTVPSYRIPVLWENYICRLRNALAPASAPAPSEAPATISPKTRKPKKGAANAATTSP